jgi:hypothetical protein
MTLNVAMSFPSADISDLSTLRVMIGVLSHEVIMKNNDKINSNFFISNTFG